MQVDSPLAARFVPAKYFGRMPGRRILWPVLHTAECGETEAAIGAVAGMFARGDRRVSAHYTLGNVEVVQSVREADLAWAAGHTANLYGVHIEIIGRAEQTPAQWADAYSDRERAWLVQLISDICQRNDIPPVRLDVEEARAMRPGILDHKTCSMAFHESNHTDVGDNYPWDELLIGVRATMGWPDG